MSVHESECHRASEMFFPAPMLIEALRKVPPGSCRSRRDDIILLTDLIVLP